VESRETTQSQTHFHPNNILSSHFLSSRVQSYRNPFPACSRICQALRSNGAFEPDWLRPTQSRKTASESPADNAALQSTENASSAMNETLAGTTAKDKHVAVRALASMRANSESVSNKIDESDVQYEKHNEQRI
jgi:hypothetical protein